MHTPNSDLSPLEILKPTDTNERVSIVSLKAWPWNSDLNEKKFIEISRCSHDRGFSHSFSHLKLKESFKKMESGLTYKDWSSCDCCSSSTFSICIQHRRSYLCTYSYHRYWSTFGSLRSREYPTCTRLCLQKSELLKSSALLPSHRFRFSL